MTHRRLRCSAGDSGRQKFRVGGHEGSTEGWVEAYLTCQVIRMRSLPFLWVKREWLWYQVNWLDGRRDEPQEDYGPGWYTVAELEQGKFEYDGVDGEFDAEPVEGPDRDRLWGQFGPPN